MGMNGRHDMSPILVAAWATCAVMAATIAHQRHRAAHNRQLAKLWMEEAMRCRLHLDQYQAWAARTIEVIHDDTALLEMLAAQLDASTIEVDRARAATEDAWRMLDKAMLGGDT